MPLFSYHAYSVRKCNVKLKIQNARSYHAQPKLAHDTLENAFHLDPRSSNTATDKGGRGNEHHKTQTKQRSGKFVQRMYWQKESDFFFYNFSISNIGED